MSDKQNLEKTADVVLPEEQTAAQQPNFSQPIIIERKHSTGKGMAGGALVLSVIALGASGFLFVQGQNIFQMQEVKVRQELEKAALGETENARKLATSLDEQQKLNAMVSQLDLGQQKSFKHLADIQRAYQELLKGRVNWLVDEIEVTLNLASQQLLLSGNVPVAITVLESIEQRLNRFEQSELLPIKKAISHDLDLLKQNAGSYIDISGTALKLDSLEKAVAGLPLLVDSTLQAKAMPEAAVPESADFWTRTWDKTVNMFQSMMEIRKLDTTDAMLLTPEQIYFVRANLRLRLLDARLALMQHNGEVYKTNLAMVESTVKQYFDTKSPTTQQWLADLAKLNQQNLSIVSDDVLKDSQAAVRDYQNQTRTAIPVNLTPVEELPAVTLPTPAANTQPASAPTAPAVQTTEPVKPASAPKAEEAKPAEAEKKEESKPSEQKADSAGKSDAGALGAAAILAAPAAALLATSKADPAKAASAPASKAEPTAPTATSKTEEAPKRTVNKQPSAEQRERNAQRERAAREAREAERRRAAARAEERAAERRRAAARAEERAAERRRAAAARNAQRAAKPKAAATEAPAAPAE